MRSTRGFSFVKNQPPVHARCRVHRLVVSALIAALLFSLPARAEARCGNLPPAGPSIVRVGYFSTPLALTAAVSQGYFAADGLTVATYRVSSSTELFACLRDGYLDVALSSPDNPVNFRLNQDNGLPPDDSGDLAGEPFDAQIFFATDHGLDLSLVARPGFSFDTLAGATVGVDSPTSGYAFVVYQVLADHGLMPSTDYTVQQVGGTPIRLSALLSGSIQATLLNSDSYVRAVDLGMGVLAPVSAVASPYLGGAASARQSWLEANAGQVVRFTRAYVRGQSWVLDPANQDAAIALLEKALCPSGASSTPPACSDPFTLASQVYAQQLDPSGLIPSGRMDLEGLYQVVVLRASWCRFKPPRDLCWIVSSASGVYDLSYWDAALASLGEDTSVAPATCTDASVGTIVNVCD